MAPEDEACFVQALLAFGTVSILSSRWNADSQGEKLTALPAPGQPFWWSLYLVPVELEDQLVYYTGVNGPTAIDAGQSPVVEFSRSKVADRLMKPGRFWVELQLIGPDGGWARKPEVVKQVYEWAAAYVRKTYRKHGSVYVGPIAQQLMAQGFEVNPVL